MPRAPQRTPLRFGPSRGTRRAPGALLVLPTATPAALRRAAEVAEGSCAAVRTVAVDGGIRACRAARRRVDLWVGDGDSAGRVPDGVPAVRYSRDKDWSDLAGALGAARRGGAAVVVVAGLLGGRLDHEWANLLELARHARRFRALVAPTARGLVVVTAAGCGLAPPRGTTFSLLALSGRTRVTLRGARWPLREQRLRPGSHGLSNVSRGPVRLTVHQGVVALVLPSR